MQLKPETLQVMYEHNCGYPIQVQIEMVPTMKNIAEVQLTSKLTYHRDGDSENLSHCPRCGKAFPGYEAKGDNFLENSLTDFGKLGNE